MNRYTINNIKLTLDESKEELIYKIAKKISKKTSSISDIEILRESFDVRKKNDIRKVYTLNFTTDKQLNLNPAINREYKFPVAELDKDKKIVIVGFGPCGMFTALLLAQMGYKPIVIERGKHVDERTADVHRFWNDKILNEESNVQFGEGGAGTFSDGKLTTGIKDYRVYKVLQELHRFGAQDDILYRNKPHIGTDVLKNVVKNIRNEIIRLGGEIKFSTRLEFINIEKLENVKTTSDGSSKIKSIIISDANGSQELACDKLVLAIGHSARDTFKMLIDIGLEASRKPFSIGARIEHPQSLINIAQYGSEDIAEILGAADYKLSYRASNDRGVYTFCMCPGGEIIMASSSNGQVVTNGMSYSARDGKYANSGLLVDVREDDFETDDIMAGVRFQEKYEHLAYDIMSGYNFPTTDLKNYIGSKLEKCLPEFYSKSIMEALPNMGRSLRGFDAPDTVLKGVETRSSSPIRFLRNEDYESNIKGIYPAGEGCGYAGGITSAAVDGIKIAEKIVL
ncbi:MAG: FAD-dependent oxidoreductase [Eubacteriales bacterium]|nr:FAD-dependent oxidoreductase [Eubacteriales bacterium]MDY3332621.1 FAD-dependent oxidoreductase [Gallibacter sp.]